MHAQTRGTDFITLTEATKITPGRPSPNCLWRWCRRGVLSRGGERIRLEHRRIGGKIFTTPDWLDDFGRVLAEADTNHFDMRECGPASLSVPSRRQPPNPSRADSPTTRDVEEAERALDDAGIQ